MRRPDNSSVAFEVLVKKEGLKDYFDGTDWSPGVAVLNPQLNVKVHTVAFNLNRGESLPEERLFAQMFWLRMTPAEFDPPLPDNPDLEVGLGYEISPLKGPPDRDVDRDEVLTLTRDGHCLVLLVHIGGSDWREYYVTLKHRDGI